MDFDLILLEDHLSILRSQLLTAQGVEQAAHMLFGLAEIASDPWTERARIRAVSHAVVPLAPGDYESASAVHVTWETAAFLQQLRRAGADGLTLGIVHTHPHGPASFSNQDDDNERELVRTAQNRNGSGTKLVSLLLTGHGQLVARLWLGPNRPVQASKITVIGRRLQVFEPGTGSPAIAEETLDRQARAFGPALNTLFRGMRFGVVGAGATGSATATLLARMGAGKVVVFDRDVVETSNLNRLHGARRSDADARNHKVEVLRREISGWAIGAQIVAIPKWASDADCRDALRACDVIFGCTDDHNGRSFLNRIPYFYGIPVIDMGVAIEPRETGGFSELSGRVTVLLPGAPCLHCQGVIDPVLAREEDLARRLPLEYERQKREAYVRGSGNPAPAVVTFTTATACLAVDELVQGLVDFRCTGGWAWQRTRRFDLLADRRPGAQMNVECPICVDHLYWGRGDVKPFMDRVG